MLERSGSETVAATTIVGGEALIQFESDSTVQAQGFELSYHVLDVMPEADLPHALTAAPESHVPTMSPVAIEHCNGRKIWRETTNGESGEISDGSGTLDYRPNAQVGHCNA